MPTVAELSNKVERLEEIVDSLQQNHNGLNEKLIRLDAKMDNYNNDLKRMSDTIIEVKNDVKKLIQEPGNKWNSVSMLVITMIISTILGYVLSNLLK